MLYFPPCYYRLAAPVRFELLSSRHGLATLHEHQASGVGHFDTVQSVRHRSLPPLSLRNTQLAHKSATLVAPPDRSHCPHLDETTPTTGSRSVGCSSTR